MHEDAFLRNPAVKVPIRKHFLRLHINDTYMYYLLQNSKSKTVTVNYDVRNNKQPIKIYALTFTSSQ